MVNRNFHIFAIAYHTKEDKNPIVNKIPNLLLWGFLFISRFTSNSSGVSTKLTGRCDKPKNLNFITSLKSQRATAIPCTTRTLKVSRSFADEPTVKDVRKLESKGCTGNTEKYLRFLNLNLKSFFVLRFILKGYATNAKAITLALKEGC